MSKKDFCWCPSCQWPICDTFKKKTINVSVQLYIILWNFSLIYYIHEFIRWRYFKNIKFFFYSLIVFFHYYILSSCKKQVLYYRIQCIKYQLNTFFQDPGSAVNFKYPIMEKAVIWTQAIKTVLKTFGKCWGTSNDEATEINECQKLFQEQFLKNRWMNIYWYLHCSV